MSERRELALRPLAGLTADELDRWRVLAAEAREPNPYFDPDFVLAAARHLDEPGVGLAVVEDADGWLACLPVRRQRGWRRVPGSCLVAWGHTYGFLDTPLLQRRAGREVMVALVGVLLAQRVGFLAFMRLGGGQVASELEAALAGRGVRAVRYADGERATLVRRDEPSYLTAALSSKRRRELRRQWRLLEEELGGPLAVVDRAGDPSASADFLALEAAGWKGEGGTAMGSEPGHAEFFAEAMAAFAARDRLELLSLESGGRPVAMKYNLIDGEGAFCFKIAHDGDLSRFSPGIQLEVAYVERFHADGRVAWVDSCAEPDNAMINRLWPDRRPVTTLIAPLPGPRGVLPAASVRAIVHARRRLGRAG